MPDKARVVTVLFAGVLWATVQGAAAEQAGREHRMDANATKTTTHSNVLQIQLIDGSVLVVSADDSTRSAANPARHSLLPLRAGTAPGNQVPQLLMRRRGQIFDPSTPGVVASIRG